MVYTPEWKVTNPRPRHTSFSVYDTTSGKWADWQKLKMPDGNKFIDSGAGCVQRVDLQDGTILLPIYFRPPGRTRELQFAYVLLMENLSNIGLMVQSWS